MAQTVIEKIAQRFAIPGSLAPGEIARAGSYIRIRPRHVMTHDNTGAVIPKFRNIGARGVADPRQPVFAIDHDIQNTSPENLAKYEKIERFAKEQGIDFYPPGRGIGHQVMIEEGYVTPGSFVVASDSHSNMYGALNALGTPVVRTDAAAIWAAGETWWQVPPQVKVRLDGALSPGATGKDVIIVLCGAFNNDEVLNCAVEFRGEGVASLTMEQRMTIANMSTEWGALAAIFPFDEVLKEYLYRRADFYAARSNAPGDNGMPPYTREDVDRWYEERILADDDAFYEKELALDLSTVAPHVSGPDSVKIATPLPEIEEKRVKVDKAYLLSCVNGRLEDMAAAAEVLKGRRVADGVKLYVAAASSEVEGRAREEGYWEILMQAGAIPLPPGCGPCIGLGKGTLEPGEVGISATNRNFKGRMGSRDARVYLAGPAVVAASAVRGYIAGTVQVETKTVRTRIVVHPKPPRPATRVEIREGFPERIEGRALFLPRHNLDTDGIYGKDYTYRDGMTPEEMGRVAMMNYDPEFQDTAREGDIIVGGKNFGTGSSREQAATALAHRGIRMVIAASFSQTYARNAFNNGFIVIACPGLVDDFFERFASGASRKLTIPGPMLAVDFTRSVIACENNTYPFDPLGGVPQDLVVAGGLENLVRRMIAVD